MTNFTLPAKLHDFIKWMVLVVLPGLSTLYIGLATAWNWDNITAIAATISAVTAFLGGLVGISSHNYRNSDERFIGETYLAPTDEGWKRIFNVTADEIDPKKKELSFKAVDSQAA